MNHRMDAQGVYLVLLVFKGAFIGGGGGGGIHQRQAFVTKYSESAKQVFLFARLYKKNPRFL